MNTQDTVLIGDFVIPVMSDRDDNKWYPVSTINRVFFDREDSGAKTTSKYEVIMFDMEYTTNSSTTITPTKVIKELDIIDWIKNRNVKTFSIQQKKNYNMLCEYFGLDKIPEKENLIYYEPDDVNNYSDYEKELYKQCDMNDKMFALCADCGIYYPVHEIFYPKHPKTVTGFTLTRCNKCVNPKFGFKGAKKNKLMNDSDKIEKQVDKIEFFIKKYGKIPQEWYNSKANCEKLINELKEDGLFTIDNFDLKKYHSELSKVNINPGIVKIPYFEATLCLFGEEFYARPYVQKRDYPQRLFTFNLQKMIFDNYLKDNKIIIDNVLTFEYGKIATEAKLYNFLRSSAGNDSCHGIMEFVLRYNDYKYPAYKFNVRGESYWDNKDNRINNLKVAIEEMELSSFEKLPLYLTKQSLKDISNTLYNILRKYYNNELYDWVNECYPDVFDPQDFNIWYRRNEFDSNEEKIIHDVLKNRFGKSLIYNAGDAHSRFVIAGHQPDWIVLEESRPIIIEYFGLYVKNRDNTRLIDYVNRTDKKIENYNKLENYCKIYIFPEDLKNNMQGLNEKLM